MLKQYFNKSTYQFAKYQAYKVQQNQNSVVDYRSLLYVPSKNLVFQDDKDLGKRLPLYIWKPKFLTYQKKFAKYNAAFVALGYLISTNPFYQTLPAALPILFCMEAFLFARIIGLMKYFRYVVREIWLHYGGETIEIVYAKQITRKMQEQPINEFLFTPNIITPKQRDDVKPMGGHLFPNSPEEDDNSNEDAFKDMRWAWTKYYYNPDTFLVIPKQADYIDMELLTAVMRGKIIQTTPENSTFTKEDLITKLTKKQ